MALTDWLHKRGGAEQAAVPSGKSPEEVIRETRRLAESRQYKEAIEFLTAANRSARRPEFERMLLALRTEAFSAGDWTGEPPAWPTHVPDQFEGQALPEIRADKLTAAAVRSGIENHGSLIVRELITASQVDLLRNNIDRVLAAFDATQSGSLTPELVGWYEPFHADRNKERPEKRSKGAILTVDSPAAFFDLLEVFESCGLSDVIREFFGEPPTLLSRKGTLRRVHHEGKTGGWHQDGGFLGEDIRSLNVWLALTDCGVDAPGMDIVAKRLPRIVETGSNFASWATNPFAAHMVADGHTVRPAFKAGDAIVFDHLCLHRTARSPDMTKTRYAIETWLMAPSTYNNMGDAILF